MERSYLNTVIGFIAIIMFGAFLLLKPNNAADLDKKVQEIFTVNMPRPIKEFFASFSLDDRNVIRIVEDAADSKKTAAAAKKADAKNATQAAVDKKVTEAEKKRQETRRQQYLQKQAQERAFRLRVVQESEKYRRELLRKELENLSNLENSLEEAYNYGARKNSNQNNVNNRNADETEAKDVLTADQWKSLILSQPNRENALKLVEAFQNNEIDMASYNEISELLMKDNSEDKRKLGVWILTAASSLESFKLATQYMTKLNADSQKLLRDYVYGYARPQTLSILEQILRSGDAELKTLAADIISKGVEKLKTSGSAVANSNRGSRNDVGFTNATLNNYKRLVPTLQWLVTNPSSGLAQWAQGLLSQLQTSTTPA